MDYKDGKLYVYDGESQQFLPAEVKSIDATDVIDYMEGGDGPIELNTAFETSLESMREKDGPQELYVTLKINNDLEIEDEESENEEA